MKLVETGSFPIADIDIGERVRGVDVQWAEGLAKLIEQTGLQHPVQIMRVGNQFRLISGAHRVKAFEILGRTDIPAMVYEPSTDQPEAEIRLQEIVENVARRELSALDRAAHIAELKETYQKLYGETRGAGSHEKNKNKGISAKVALFSLGDEVASKMGLSKRTIFADAELFSKLSAATRKALAQTPFADSRSQLVALAKLNADDQKALLKLILGENPKAGTVGEALAQHFNKIDTKNPDEIAMAKFKKLWAVASKPVKKAIAREVAAWEASGGK